MSPTMIIHEDPKQYIHHDQLYVKALTRWGIVCAVERLGIIHENDEVQVLVNDFKNPMQ